jgi:hypothetical protein
MRRSSNMRHPTNTYKLLKYSSNKLRPIIPNDLGLDVQGFLGGTLEDDFYILFRHLLPDFPMHPITDVTIQNRTHGVKDTMYIDILVLVRFLRLGKAFPRGSDKASGADHLISHGQDPATHNFDP